MEQSEQETTNSLKDERNPEDESSESDRTISPVIYRKVLLTPTEKTRLHRLRQLQKRHATNLSDSSTTSEKPCLSSMEIVSRMSGDKYVRVIRNECEHSYSVRSYLILTERAVPPDNLKTNLTPAPLTSAERSRAYRQRKREKRLKEKSSLHQLMQKNSGNNDLQQPNDESSTSTEPLSTSNDNESLDYDRHMVDDDKMYFEEGESIVTSSGCIGFDQYLLNEIKTEPTSNSTPTNDTQEDLSVNELKSPRKSDTHLENLDAWAARWRIRLNNNRRLWSYFEEVNEERARCTSCNKLYKYSNGLGTLKQHIIERHLRYNTKIERKKKIRSLKNEKKVWSYFEIVSEVRARCTNCDKVYKYDRSCIQNLQTHLTKTHDLHFTKIYDKSEDDNSVQKPLSMKLRSQLKSTATVEVFEEINSVMEEDSDDEQITNSILRMLVVDKMPVSTVENEGFKNLLKTIAPRYTIPDTETFSRLLDTIYKSL